MDVAAGGRRSTGSTTSTAPLFSGSDASAGHHPTMPDRWSTGTDRRRKLRDATSNWSGVTTAGASSSNGATSSRSRQPSLSRPDVWTMHNEGDGASEAAGRAAKASKKRSSGGRKSSASTSASSSFVQVGGETGDVWYRQGTGSASPALPTQRNDISGGAGAGIGGFLLSGNGGDPLAGAAGGHGAPAAAYGNSNNGGEGGGQFVLEEGDSLEIYGDDYDRPPIQAEHRGGRRGGGGKKWGRGKRRYRSGGGGGGKRKGGKGKKRSSGGRGGQNNGSSSAWTAREAGVGTFHSFGDDLGSGATLNF